MNRIPIQSSNILSVGYDPDAKILEIEFRGSKKSGSKVYRYFGIPGWICYDLTDPNLLLYDGSKGTYFAKVVKGRFKYEEVKEDTDGPIAITDSNKD